MIDLPIWILVLAFFGFFYDADNILLIDYLFKTNGYYGVIAELNDDPDEVTHETFTGEIYVFLT